jgi:hypothetical protein
VQILTADEFVVRFEEIFTLPHAVRMVGLVAVPGR